MAVLGDVSVIPPFMSPPLLFAPVSLVFSVPLSSPLCL
jgi:hypothetical protein